MRKLVVSMFVSLDGVMEDPAWTRPYWNDDIANFKFDELVASDALLLGRVTYELFAAAWPTKKHAEAMESAFSALPKPGEFSERMNNIAKFVASRTRTSLEWNGSNLIQANLVEEVSRLKQQAGQNILLVGSGTIARTLMKHGLVDEYRLLVYPIVHGCGKRLFEEGSRETLELVEAKPLKSNVVHLCYRPIERDATLA